MTLKVILLTLKVIDIVDIWWPTFKVTLLTLKVIDIIDIWWLTFKVILLTLKVIDIVDILWLTFKVILLNVKVIDIIDVWWPTFKVILLTLKVTDIVDIWCLIFNVIHCCCKSFQTQLFALSPWLTWHLFGVFAAAAKSIIARHILTISWQDCSVGAVARPVCCWLECSEGLLAVIGVGSWASHWCWMIVYCRCKHRLCMIVLYRIVLYCIVIVLYCIVILLWLYWCWSMMQERIETRSRGRRKSANKSRVIPSKSSKSSKSSKPSTSKWNCRCV